MNMTASVLRRLLCGVFASCLAGGAAAVAVVIPSATAASDPCAASEIARTIGAVATNTASYLDSHPDTNNALTAASQQEGPQALAGVKSYFDTHQQAGKDLQAPSPQSATVPQGVGPLPGPGVPVLAPAPSTLTPASPTAVSSVR